MSVLPIFTLVNATQLFHHRVRHSFTLGLPQAHKCTLSAVAAEGQKHWRIHTPPDAPEQPSTTDQQDWLCKCPGSPPLRGKTLRHVTLSVPTMAPGLVMPCVTSPLLSPK